MAGGPVRAARLSWGLRSGREPHCNRLPIPSEGPTRPFQPPTPTDSRQEPGGIITTVSADKRPRTLKGFTGTTQQGSPLSR